MRGLLRLAATSDDYGGYLAEVCEQAADLIESLTAELHDADTRMRVEYCESTGYDGELRSQLTASQQLEVAG